MKTNAHSNATIRRTFNISHEQSNYIEKIADARFNRNLSKAVRFLLDRGIEQDKAHGGEK